jgi:hypothetical protein
VGGREKEREREKKEIRKISTGMVALVQNTKKPQVDKPQQQYRFV